MNNKKINYKCKENDNKIKLILSENKLDEIWVGTPLKSDGWIVIGARDLENSLKLINGK